MEKQLVMIVNHNGVPIDVHEQVFALDPEPLFSNAGQLELGMTAFVFPSGSYRSFRARITVVEDESGAT